VTLSGDAEWPKVADAVIEAVFRLREGLDSIRAAYDVVLIDCVPAFGYLNTASLNAADRVLIPLKPAPFALQGLRDFLETITKVQRRLNQELRAWGIVLNLVEGRPTTIASELEGVLREEYAELILATVLHKAVRLEESPAWNQSIMEYAPRSKPAEEFQAFLTECLQRLGM